MKKKKKTHSFLAVLATLFVIVLDMKFLQSAVMKIKVSFHNHILTFKAYGSVTDTSRNKWLEHMKEETGQLGCLSSDFSSEPLASQIPAPLPCIFSAHLLPRNSMASFLLGRPFCHVPHGNVPNTEYTSNHTHFTS